MRITPEARQKIIEGGRLGAALTYPMLLAAMKEFGTDRWAQRAAHGRWHVLQNRYSQNCEFCAGSAND